MISKAKNGPNGPIEPPKKEMSSKSITSQKSHESQTKSLPPVPTTITSKATISMQTVQNVTFLLNNLLQQYDNSLRPDLGGKTRKRWLPFLFLQRS